MSRSLSNPAGSFPAPNDEEPPVDTIEERDQLWYEGLDNNLFDAYHRMAWQEAYRIVKDPDEATDVADETMEELIRHPPSKAELKSHLYRIARHNAIDCYRSRRHKLRIPWNSIFRKSDDGEEYEVLPESCYPLEIESEVIAKEDFEFLMRQLEQGLNHCNSLQRVCFILHFVKGMESKEIAEELGISVAKVSAAVSRVKKRFCKLLKQEKEKGKEKERRSSQ